MDKNTKKKVLKIMLAAAAVLTAITALCLALTRSITGYADCCW